MVLLSKAIVPERPLLLKRFERVSVPRDCDMREKPPAARSLALTPILAGNGVAAAALLLAVSAICRGSEAYGVGPPGAPALSPNDRERCRRIPPVGGAPMIGAIVP
jgi:hypothetical protein